MAKKKVSEVNKSTGDQITVTQDEILEAAKPLIVLLNSKGADSQISVCVSTASIVVKRDLADLVIQYNEESSKE